MARTNRIWRGGREQKPSSSQPGAGWEQAIDDLKARVAHLEAELEGLQDAVYRQALVQGEQITELRNRTQPAQLARDLSEEARRRGVE